LADKKVALRKGNINRALYNLAVKLRLVKVIRTVIKSQPTAIMLIVLNLLCGGLLWLTFGETYTAFLKDTFPGFPVFTGFLKEFLSV